MTHSFIPESEMNRTPRQVDLLLCRTLLALAGWCLRLSRISAFAWIAVLGNSSLRLALATLGPGSEDLVSMPDIPVQV